ncbi:MAG: hypothetical protein ACK4QL_05050 [Pseudanabaenaceae cyanobacterium]
MSTYQSQYDTLLSYYSTQENIVTLLRQHRLYFEMIPSLRRPADCLICVPLPVVKLASAPEGKNHTQLECDIAVVMCDPDWKVKIGREIFIFIHRPGEDFATLLKRWRQVEVTLSDEYSLLLPIKYHNLLGDRADYLFPLFVTLDYTPSRIRRGLEGASLPYVNAELPKETIEPPSDDNPERLENFVPDEPD